MRAFQLPDLSTMDGGAYVPPDFETDGCTCAPDFLGNIDLRPACCVHDWEYSAGGGEPERLKADRRLRANMRKCGAPKYAAAVYFRRVRFWGATLFHYWAGRRPVSIWWLMVRVFFARWWQ